MLKNYLLIQIVLVLLIFNVTDTPIVCLHLRQVDEVVYMAILDGIYVGELKLFSNKSLFIP